MTVEFKKAADHEEATHEYVRRVYARGVEYNLAACYFMFRLSKGRFDSDSLHYRTFMKLRDHHYKRIYK